MGFHFRAVRAIALLLIYLPLLPSAYADNVLRGLTGYTFSVAPNGANLDTNPTSKLTDGAKPWAFLQSVQWNLAAVAGNTVDITFTTSATQELEVFNTHWAKWGAGAPLPESVQVWISLDGTSFELAGSQWQQTSADITVNIMTLTLESPRMARAVRFRVRRPCSGVIALVEAEACTAAPRGNMAIGYAYEFYGTLPDGGRTGKQRLLTDGLFPNDSAKAVAWTMSGNMPAGDPQIALTFDRPTTVTRVATLWQCDGAHDLFLPEIVNAYGAGSSGEFAFLGTMTVSHETTQGVTRLSWSGSPVSCSQLAVVFNRGISHTGTVALLEMEVRGSPRPVETHHSFALGLVTSLTCGSDVFFRPQGNSQRPWADPPPERIPEIVRALHDNYYANTVYVEYNGEVDRATALELYKIWETACASRQVKLVPMIGLVQWDYLRQVNPSAEYGHQFYYNVSPVMDLQNSAGRFYFRDFVHDLLASCPKIDRIGAIDINQYALARGLGYPYSLADLVAWSDAVLSDIGARQKALIFQQPAYAGASELSGISSRLLDTYSYLLYETYADLISYVSQDTAVASHVEGDLVIVTDPGDRFDPAVEVKAARAIEAAGANLSLDLIITSAVMRDAQGESFWFNLLDDGFYQGYYQPAFEAVRQRFRMHHGQEPNHETSGASRVWTIYP